MRTIGPVEREMSGNHIHWGIAQGCFGMNIWNTNDLTVVGI